MSVAMSTLENGLRIVTDRMAHVETVSIGVYVGTGARHESTAEHGISHLLEHMAFKGTRQRTARQIAEEIEHVGGDLNAATGLETTAYYARVLKGDEAVALDILSDILLNPTYDADDLEREKDVILQEIAGINDSPEELAYDLLQDAAFPNQALGRPIIGTRESVTKISGADLRTFLATRYRAGRTVIAAAGAIEHDRLVDLARQTFAGMPAEAISAPEQACYAGGLTSSSRPFEQSHLLLGFESASYHDPHFYAVQVFSGLLGGGMSSRLFQEVRENRGLCYSIYSSAWGLADVGMLTIHAATGPDELSDLIEVVAHELDRIRREPPNAAELHRAKAQIKVALLSGLESTAARAEQISRHLMVAGRVIPTTELIRRVDAVSPDDMVAVAARLLRGARPTIAIVGAGDASARHAEAASGLLTG
jgi:predicted Zn-dependent peptidase